MKNLSKTNRVHVNGGALARGESCHLSVGDRVKLGMTGKFLPFKYYGATGNAQAYGYKEE